MIGNRQNIGMSRPQRIAIVVHAVASQDSRIRRQTDALEHAGYAVDVFGLRGEGELPEEARNGVRSFRLPVDRWFTGFGGHMVEYAAFASLAMFRLAREHRRRRYDLIQIATVPDFLVFSALPERMVGVPVLLDLHEDMPEFFSDRFRSPLLMPLLPAVELTSRAAAATATELLTVHEPLRELSVRRGVDPERITVVMNSADPRLFDPDRHRRRPYMADGSLRLVHHSNFQRIYGLDLLVRAVAAVPDLDVHLTAYGDGPWRGAVEEAIRETGTEARVTLAGRIPIDELPARLAEADVGVVPTRPEPYMRYSLSTKLLEYAALGMPVIASDLATFRHHFTDAALRYVRAGDVEALAGAIREAAREPSVAQARGAEARRQAAAYGWDRQRDTYLEVVSRLLAHRGR
jgi:glycosyltransferase involved in cell wall biosynthesis